MKHLHTVDDVMTHAVVSVAQGAMVKEIVETMQRWRISALPVVSAEGRVLGVVSEADLLRKAEGTDTSHDICAGQLMTVPPLTVRRYATITGAARLMARGHLKRLPVVDDDDRLVGVVSRGDLLKIYLRSDEDIAEEVREVLMKQLIPGGGSAVVRVHVDHGLVRLTGSIPDPAMHDVLVRATRSVPGVVDVKLRAEVPA
ncbi:CBS domain-containing protein [Streptomyces sp. NRRL S-87]|uniref:CBS domain-containing protein n=1 Tax=Streptomyces sp. NRRL S-87 TaxID=1463920 RepID=UPI00056B73FF|nr:CBS domain-containing protein [Streptomyces sp. NRRL S-87]